MTPEQITLVQTTFDQIRPAADTATALFYKRLFLFNPELRPLFPADMRDQERKLMQMLSVVVNSLNRLEQLVPAIQALGRRHGSYGVAELDYGSVGAALLWTLQYALREQWTFSVEATWTTAYTVLAETMKAACVEAIVS